MSVRSLLRHALTQLGTSAPLVAAAVRNSRRLLLALVVGAVAIGSFALASPASAATLGYHGRTAAESQMGTALLQQLNAERRAHHLAPLTMNKSLMSSARSHDFTMARFDTMSHQLPHEPVFTSRIRNAGYKWEWAGENVAWNSVISTAGVLQLESIMYDEVAPDNDHRLNILSKHYDNIGVDVFVDRVHQRVWLTTDFGSR